jgi:alkyl hydroperoxide reductase subunit D
MAMNNVYYRFRHAVDSPAYWNKPMRLRMNRLVHPSSSKGDMELFALAVSAINGCASCMQAHERSLLQAGMTQDQVHEAIRIASTMASFAVALDIARADDLERQASRASGVREIPVRPM